jgi:multiple sugar transport system permease protein
MLLITNTIAIFNLFDEPKIMTGGGPAKATETLVLYAFDKAYTGGEYSYAITITTIAFIIVFLLTLVQMKLQKRSNL